MPNRRARIVLTGIALAIGVLSAANQVREFVCAPAASAREAQQRPATQSASGVDVAKVSRVLQGTDALVSNTPVYRQQLKVTRAVLGAAYSVTLGMHAREVLLAQGWGGVAQTVARSVEPWVTSNRSRLQPLDR